MILLWASALACAFAAPAGAATVERTGHAYEPGKQNLLYSEEHEEWLAGDEVVRSTVIYRDAGGNIIATKYLDFSRDPTSPDFQLRNSVNGHVEGARREGADCVVFFRKTGRDKYREDRIALPEHAIIDGGFDRFIEMNWRRLLDGHVFRRPFLVPSFHKFIDFKIYLEKSTDADVVFVMEPASFFLRVLSDPITVTYDRRSASLKLYEGVSNIRDQAGENLDVRVEFAPAEGDKSNRTAVSSARVQ